MKFRALSTLAALALWVLPLSGQVIDGLVISDGGHFAMGDIGGSIQIFGEGWSSANQSPTTVKANGGFPKKKAGSFELDGVFQHPKSGAFALKQKFLQTAPGVMEAKYSLSHEGPVKLNSLAVTLSLPMGTFAGKNLLIDGKAVALPKDYEKGKTQVLGTEFTALEIPTAAGRIRIKGPKRLLVQDNREYKGTDFSIRLYFTPGDGEVTSAELSMTVEISGLDSQVVDLSKAANMVFADEYDADGKGGWTDQGKDNDLRQMKPGNIMAAGIKFKVIDPAQGNSAVIFGGKGRDNFPKKAEVNAGGFAGKTFYLLHATAWTPAKGTQVGSLTFQFADGSKETRAVTCGVEVGDWWNASDLTNGVVVWNATNASTSVGLYASAFEISEKPLQSIVFSATGNAVWMVVAATVSKDRALLQSVQIPVYVAAGPDWAPIVDPRRIEGGGALDLSFLQKETGIPAGQFGSVKVVGPHFEFEKRPGVKARFAGGNLCFSANFLTHEQADAITERLARMGHNSVRIHHYERDMMDPNRPVGSQAVIPGKMDQLDYLIGVCKKRGIYITTDVFVSRTFKNGDIPGYDITDKSIYKALVFLGPARDDFKRWAKWLLIDHVNPYTGLPLGKDPVLATLSLVNEGNLLATWSDFPSTQKLALEMFQTWLAKNGLPEGTGHERTKRLTRFLIETQREGIQDLMAYVKGLGVNVPLTDCNMIDNALHIPLRQEMDFVDTHAYWDHPGFPEGNWRMPYRYSLKQVVKELGSMPTLQAGSRIFGKPFTITEYQYCFPNPYRAEGSLLMAAVSGLQDWDGLWRFALAHSSENLFEERPVSGFDVLVDPVNMLGEQLMTLSFLRQDIKPAKGAVAMVLDEQFLKAEDGIPTEGWNSFPKDYHQWALRSQIGTFMALGKAPVPGIHLAMTPQTKSTPAVPGVKVETLGPDFMKKRGEEGLLPEGFNPPAGITRAETGEFELDANVRSFRLMTPRLEAVVLPEGGEVKAGNLKAKSLGQYGIVAATSLDGLDVNVSSRILILHLTEINNLRMRYRNKMKNLVENWGSAQRLVARGQAQVELTVKKPKAMKLFGCDLSGKRVEEIPLTTTATSVSFLAETVRDSKARYMVYELVGAAATGK